MEVRYFQNIILTQFCAGGQRKGFDYLKLNHLEKNISELLVVV